MVSLKSCGTVLFNHINPKRSVSLSIDALFSDFSASAGMSHTPDDLLDGWDVCIYSWILTW